MRIKVYFIFFIVFFTLIVFTLITTVLINFTLLKHEIINEVWLPANINDEYRNLLHIIETKQLIDKSGSFSIVANILSTKLINQNKKAVTLVTHCSANHLYHILDIYTRWSGPISLALFSDGSYPSIALDILLNLKRCYPAVFSRTVIHFVFYSKANFAVNMPSLHKLAVCENIRQDLKRRNNIFKNYDMNVEYPNNLLRNVAIKSSKTSHIFVIDIDMLPSPHLFTKFSHFLEKIQLKTNFSSNNILRQRNSQNINKIAYIVPSFEISHSVFDLPSDKNQVLKLWNHNLLKPFYFDMCPKCQLPTNYPKWFSENFKGEENALKVIYQSSWSDRWEPFLVVPISAPRYDERFRQYGFNRISQVCELHIAGFEFYVLDSVFLLHIGFKSNLSFHRNKDREQNINRMHYNIFKEEIKDKYPHSNKSCK